MMTMDTEPTQGAWLTPKDLRRRNRVLAKVGRRICRTHQEAALPLDEAHFYYAKRSVGQFDTECKACKDARDLVNKRTRYQTDGRYRQRILKRQRQRRVVQREQVLVARRAYRRRVRVQRLTGILAGVRTVGHGRAVGG